MKKIYFSIITLSLLLTACAGGKTTPPIETYSLNPTPLAQNLSSSKNQNVTRIMTASIAPQFSNDSFIYRLSSAQYLTDPYRQFLTAPNIEVSTYLENKLTPLLNTTLVSSDNLTPANFILQENITQLYADYQNKSMPEAVTSIQFILYHYDNGVTKQISTLSLSAKTSIMPNNPTSLIDGYQNNLDKIAEKLSIFLNKQL